MSTVVTFDTRRRFTTPARPPAGATNPELQRAIEALTYLFFLFKDGSDNAFPHTAKLVLDMAEDRGYGEAV